MFKEFQNLINQSYPNLYKQRTLIAVSGGIDSMVLLHLMHKANLNLAVAHCNFTLRGEESDAEEIFVKETVADYDYEFFVERFPTQSYAAEKGLNTQLAARELRYAWFNHLAELHNFDHIAVAHHANDKIETFLINLSRGTGIDGLSGIPEKNQKIIRPLLPFSRAQITAYAKENNIDWKEDSSNSSDKYIRNKIRHHIVPILEELHPNFLNNFLQTQEFLSDTSQIVAKQVEELKSILFIKEDGLIKIPVQQLKVLHPLRTYLYELFKDYNFTNWDDIGHLLDAMSGKAVYSKTHELSKDRSFLILRKIPLKLNTEFIYEKLSETIHDPIHLNVTKVTEIEEKDANTIYVDAEKLNLPLIVRKWHTGDYFHPFGMKGKKKVSKFFKDEKFSLPEKETQWILLSQDQIVWIIGKRADQRFAVSPKTTSILKIQLQP
ncbi:tRNA(Ile)-lysidine synthase [Pustulibacterium marinum]|uniref:tRNA(Ile)-lysidine synthase n=1 Tax=Pustulibacterium marinum TaxID=1224947 RepID=A0A1I7FP40_9FLAO|nr:tRNA lysidine(34) synthetase TilS [Pustulibacterium marinum]SFU37979.1 tRNA(Ile)-lysidine synthase [Pustulibacterium marinum]